MVKWFIDDERFPPNSETDWIILRSSKAAIDQMLTKGMPDFISFDHDLGGEDTSMVFVKEMIERTLNGEVNWPKEFNFYVHSQNPIGAKNIYYIMENFLINQEIW